MNNEINETNEIATLFSFSTLHQSFHFVVSSTFSVLLSEKLSSSSILEYFIPLNPRSALVYIFLRCRRGLTLILRHREFDTEFWEFCEFFLLSTISRSCRHRVEQNLLSQVNTRFCTLKSDII